MPKAVAYVTASPTFATDQHMDPGRMIGEEGRGLSGGVATADERDFLTRAQFRFQCDNPALALQTRHVDVEIHPVDAFDRKLHMAIENIGHALCYHAPGSGRGFAPACAGAFRPLSGPI